MKYPAYSRTMLHPHAPWIGELPSHWRLLRGRFIMQVNPAAPRVRELELEDEVSFVPMESVGERGGLALDQTRVLAEISAGYTAFQDGDVIVAKITPCFENGKGALACDLMNGMAFGTTELHVLRVGEALNNRFLFYLTLSDAFRKLGQAEMYGAGGQKRVPPEFNKDFQVPLPPLAEQHLVANFLDWKTSQIDALIAKKTELVEKLKEKRTAIITRAITKGLNPDAPLRESGIAWLGEVPQHWEVKKLSRVTASRCDGPFGSGLKSEHYTDEGVRVIRLQNIEYAVFDDEDKVYIDHDYYLSELGDHSVHPGDLLVAGLGDKNNPVGRACRAPNNLGPAMVKADCFRYRLEPDKADSGFLAYAMSVTASALAGALASGVTRPRMNLSLTSDRVLAFPPVAEQIEITKNLDFESEQIHRMIEKVDLAIQQLSEYSLALITAATTGQIDVRHVVIPTPAQS